MKLKSNTSIFNSTLEDVTLPNGRVIIIQGFAVFSTYHFSGLLEGLPTEEVNQELLKSINEFANRCGPIIENCHIVTPKYYEVTNYHGKARFVLPQRFVVLDLQSDGFADNEACSSARIVRFFESSDDVAKSIGNWIKEIDWELVATNWSP